MPYEGRSTRADFIRRLGYLCAGLAIGFVLVGFIKRMKDAHRQRIDRQAREAAQQPPAGPSIFPPAPTSPSPEAP